MRKENNIIEIKKNKKKKIFMFIIVQMKTMQTKTNVSLENIQTQLIHAFLHIPHIVNSKHHMSTEEKGEWRRIFYIFTAERTLNYN